MHGSVVSIGKQSKETLNLLQPVEPIEATSVLQLPPLSMMYTGKALEPIQAKYQLEQEKSYRLQESYEANMRVSATRFSLTIYE